MSRLAHSLKWADKRAEELDSVPTEPQFVYFVQSGPYIKIGVASDVKHRVSTLQTSTPNEVTLLFSLHCKDAYAQEKELHAALFKYHHRGEWFKIPTNAPVMALIKKQAKYASSNIVPLPEPEKPLFYDI